MRQLHVHLLLLISVSSAIFFTNLGATRLWDRDEPRNAGCAAEMLERGDWVVPTFNDELRHQKPALLYWLMMTAYQVFGQSEFSARFWSALLAVGTVLATYGIASRLTTPIVGLIAGIILSTNLMFDVAARAATPDSVLIFCNTMAIWIYVTGVFRPQVGDSNSSQLTGDMKSEVTSAAPNRHSHVWFPQSIFVVAAFYAMLGLGVLAKGPIGFLLPMAVVGLFVWIKSLSHNLGCGVDLQSARGFGIGSKSSGEFADQPGHRQSTRGWMAIAMDAVFHFSNSVRAMRPVFGVAIVLIVAAPWYVLVDGRTDGDFTRLFFVGEHFDRATMAMENHSGGWWYYPLAILVGFFPWSIFWGPVAIAIWNHRRNAGRMTDAELLCLIWIGLQVGLFSLVQTKLPSYVTPCYPALSILTSVCLVRWAQRETTFAAKWLWLALSALVVGGVLVSTGLGIAAMEFFPRQRWLLLMGLIPIAGAGIAVWRLRQSKRQQVLMTMMATSILFCFLMFGFGTVAIDSVQQNQLVLDPIAAASDGQVVASYRSLESSWIYYGDKPIYECAVEPMANTQTTLARDNWWEPKPRVSPERMVELKPNAIFITTDEHLAELKNRLPGDFEIAQTAGYFLKKKRHLVSLRRRPERTAAMPTMLR